MTAETAVAEIVAEKRSGEGAVVVWPDEFLNVQASRFSPLPPAFGFPTGIERLAVDL